MAYIAMNTTVEDLILTLGYDEVKELFKNEIDEEIRIARAEGFDEGYDTGLADSKM